MKRIYHYLSVVVVCFILAGCSYGARSRLPLTGSPIANMLNRPVMGVVYTHTIKPFDVNMNQTPVGTRKSDGDVKFISYSYFNFMWDTNAIGDIAKENGIETIYYADLETLSILGVWNQYTIRIYGK